MVLLRLRDRTILVPEFSGLPELTLQHAWKSIV